MSEQPRGALAPLSVNSLLNSAIGSIPGDQDLRKLFAAPPNVQVLRATKTPAPAASKKRSAPTDVPSAMSEEQAEAMIEDAPIDKSCNQVRTLIRNFIEAGGMKVGEFQKAIGVSAKSYSTFMGKNGSDGSNTATYGEAWAFFKKRELMGIPMPKKAKKAANAPILTPREVGQAATSRLATAKLHTKEAGPLTADQLQRINLDGEDKDDVLIFDDCDDIRRKISAHLSKPGTTAAQLCRDIAAMYKREDKKIQNKVLTDFRNKKGPLAGNTSSVFYGAYCYFEKVRIAEGKPKSAKRLKNEDKYAAEGGINHTVRESGWEWRFVG